MALESDNVASTRELDDQQQPKRRRKRRWGDAVSNTANNNTEVTSTTAASSTTSNDPVRNKIMAMQQSVKARLAAAKAAAAGTAPSPVKRAKHYDLNLDVTGPTYRQQQTAAATSTDTLTSSSKSFKDTKKTEVKKKKKNTNPYLAHHDEDDEHDESATEHESKRISDTVDERLSSRTSKSRPRHKEFKFNAAGHWQAIAEQVREKAAMAEAAGFVSGRKSGHTVKSAGLASTGAALDTMQDDGLNDGVLAPRADAKPETKMPICVEWWDMDLLPSKMKKEVAALEATALTQQTKSAVSSVGKSSFTLDDAKSGADQGMVDEEELRQRCLEHSHLTNCRTASLVQHIVPIKPPSAYKGPPKEPVLQLTKKELKRQRKLRRQEKQRELQDLQAAGLIPAPEPRLTLGNFIQVLGDSAYVDPSQMEKKVQEQIQARQRAHVERNEAKKLTKDQRSAKRARKFEEDTSTGVSVAVFYVKDMSHPYHRTKVDLNAQQNNLSGGVLESEVPQMACVICEGGPKAIKRYTRLMLVRMKWTGPADGDEEDGVMYDREDEERKFRSDNQCALVWQGMVVKPAFKGFIFQSVETSDQARKVLKAKGVEHYWDQVVQRASGKLGFQLRLGSDDGDDEEQNDNPYQNAMDRADVEMQED